MTSSLISDTHKMSTVGLFHHKIIVASTETNFTVYFGRKLLPINFLKLF